MNKDETRRENKNQKAWLTLLFGIGLAPVFIAYFVYLFYPEVLPVNTTNQGQLISPPVPNNAIGLDLTDRKWSLIMPVGLVCEADCTKRFYLARQVNIALGKEANRVKRLLVSVEKTPDSTVEGLRQLYRDMEHVKLDEFKLKNALGDVVADSVSGNYVFLMDPNGNIMMFYSLDKIGKPMLMDIKHLLKISNIG